MIYNKSGVSISSAYNKGGTKLTKAYNKGGSIIYSEQEYYGGYIEIQPDSFVAGTVPSTDSTSNLWGFPYSLSAESKSAIKSEILSGNGYGMMYIRFPLGFGYRGFRNIDSTTGLAKNIGERFSGQNTSLHDWFTDIVSAGGGLAPEYWCVAPYWTTLGAYADSAKSKNYISAGGSYPQSTKLIDIKDTDNAQYQQRISDLADAIINDLEYLHTNIAPVRMFGLAGEPENSGVIYGKCEWDADVYCDTLSAVYPKILASTVLSTYNGQPNTIKLHCGSSVVGFDNAVAKFINQHSDWIWTYSQDATTHEAGQNALRYKNYINTLFKNKESVFCCEFEYFNDSIADDFRCGNNILRLIFELAICKAKVLHPIIHICKPTGQTGFDSNTRGYCLYAVDMADGSYTTNAWAYNSWKMFNDNLHIGSLILPEYNDLSWNYCGCVGAVYDDKLSLFMANNSSTEQQITVNVGSAKSFTGKKYSSTECGVSVDNINGTEITFTIPALSGLVYKEVE